MLQRPAIARPISVLVATPAGRTGQGGIDRVMAVLGDALAQEGSNEIELRFGSTRGSGSILLSPFYQLRFCAQMVAGRLAGRCDVLHINLASKGSTHRKLMVAALARLLRLPYVVHLHGATYREYWDDASPALDHAITGLFVGAAEIVVLGRVWRDYIARRLPELRDRITIVPNATALRPARIATDAAAHILFLGRLGDRKGIPQLIEALAALDRTQPWRATLAGDGEIAATRRAVEAAGLADRVDIPGWVGAEQVDRLLGAADILVLPSLSENLPMSVIEGMAAGLAIITTPVGAVTDIITDGETGLLVPPLDVPALTAALSHLVTDGADRRRLGNAARHYHQAHLGPAPFLDALRQVWRRAHDNASAGRPK